MISRRLFLAISGSTILAPRISWAANEIPTLLDHILLGSNDLDHGIAFVQQHTGVRAAFGGVHPGRGTQNALLSLGERRYLEIIAPDPKQNDIQSWAVDQLKIIKELTTPRLIGWAAHPGDLEALAKKLRESGITIQGPWPGSRTLPDGRVLNWKTINLDDDRKGVLPFFIEWGANSIHPSVDAPKGCHLQNFAIADPNPDELSKVLQRLGIDTSIERGERPQLRARITSARGKLEVSS
jgi:Glyoxalase-like domain